MRPFFSLLPLLIFTSLIYGQKLTVQFDHQALLVSNLDKAAGFYQSVLGLEEIEDRTGQPHIRWFAMGGGKQLHLIAVSEKTEIPPKGVHMAFSSKNLDRVIDHLKVLGIYFENWMGEEKMTNLRPDGIRQIYLQDPDGYWIEINGK